MRLETRFTAFDRARDTFFAVAVITLARRIVANRRTDQSTRNRCGIVAATAAELVADDATDDRADQGAATAITGTAVDSVVLHLFPALLDRSLDRHIINNWLR